MKKLELNQMVNLQASGNIGTCAGYGTAVLVTGVIIGAATGGVGLALGALLGGWLGAYSYGACLFK